MVFLIHSKTVTVEDKLQEVEAAVEEISGTHGQAGMRGEVLRAAAWGLKAAATYSADCLDGQPEH